MENDAIAAIRTTPDSKSVKIVHADDEDFPQFEVSSVAELFGLQS
jgi:hypothetical protein